MFSLNVMVLINNSIRFPSGALYKAKIGAPATIPIPQSAKTFHDKLVVILKELYTLDCRSSLDKNFRDKYNQALHLFETYQNEIVRHYNRKITCTKGCAWCCYHWVEDVYSFEAEIIADFLKTSRNHDLPALREQLRDDEAALVDLDNLVEKKLADSPYAGELDDNDRIDLLLASYYQLKRPCPLLDDNGACTIYPLRPLTCRIYVSFFDPRHCTPEVVDHEDSRTYLLNCEEPASAILDQIHFKHLAFEEDTGLRSLLLKYLQEI
ncbi:MAG: hypothetical protein GF401_04485 [Chitinivibrionales bacterium]|nr:hypothetical protein [Chitinivibrionales bacterium]